jgi:hypothetical protein
MAHRTEQLPIDRCRIHGVATLARDGFRSRVADMLNASDGDFVALTDVTIEPLYGGPAMSCEFPARAQRSFVAIALWG